MYVHLYEKRISHSVEFYNSFLQKNVYFFQRMSIFRLLSFCNSTDFEFFFCSFHKEFIISASFSPVALTNSTLPFDAP